MRPKFALLVLLALLACKNKPPAPSEYEYHIFVEGQAGTLVGAEMAGKALEGGRKEARGMSYWVKVPAGEHASDRAFSVLVATSCGTEKLPATLTLGIARGKGAADEDRERAGTKPGAMVLTELEYTAPKLARVFVDADGAGSAKVEVGTTVLPTSQAEHDVVVGTCATAKDAKVDGKPAGTVNDRPRTVDGPSGKRIEVPGTTLIDPTGKHCYEVVKHVYADKETDTSNMARSEPKRLEGSKLYLEEVDDFLKESPKEMKSEDAFPMRNEIRRCAAKGGKRR